MEASLSHHEAKPDFFEQFESLLGEYDALDSASELQALEEEYARARQPPPPPRRDDTHKPPPRALGPPPPPAAASPAERDDEMEDDADDAPSDADWTESSVWSSLRLVADETSGGGSSCGAMGGSCGAMGGSCGAMGGSSCGAMGAQGARTAVGPTPLAASLPARRVGASVVTHPASALQRDGSGRAAHSFGRVPRFSPSGTMAHHCPKALPLAAVKPQPTPAHRGDARGDGTPPRRARAARSPPPTFAPSQCRVWCARRPQSARARMHSAERGGENVCNCPAVEEAEDSRGRPTKSGAAPYMVMTNGHTPRSFGASALGVHRFHHRPTKPRAPLPKASKRRGEGGYGTTVQSRPHDDPLVAPIMDIVECCGDPYDGYCCKRHHPDDDIICCTRHRKENEMKARYGLEHGCSEKSVRGTHPNQVGRAWPSRTTSPAFTFSRAASKGPFRETAVAHVFSLDGKAHGELLLRHVGAALDQLHALGASLLAPPRGSHQRKAPLI
ncbi:hypothetical protein AB1Y20_015671 [Prymnesium parvum]|uniref:Uncharacterized protein n=1 Tax=Prymnesium parvum TaxID=97485 RepID=A0AB34K1L6_PRYPA